MSDHVRPALVWSFDAASEHMTWSGTLTLVAAADSVLRRRQLLMVEGMK